VRRQDSDFLFFFSQKTAGLLQGKRLQARKLKTKPRSGGSNPSCPAGQQSILLQGVTVIIWGTRAVLAGSSQDRFVSPPSFVQGSPGFVRPVNLKFVLFSVLHSSQGQREEFKPISSEAARPQRRMIWHGGANVPNKTITAGKLWESLFRWSPSKHQSSMTACM